MSKNAQLISGAMLSYVLADGTDVDPGTYTDIADMVTSIPELYSKPDTVDTTTVDNTTQTNIPGLSGGDSLDFGVLLSPELYTLHALILASQEDTVTGGNTWFKLTFDAPLSRNITWRGAVSDNVVVNGGQSADLAEGVLPIYPSTDLVEAANS